MPKSTFTCIRYNSFLNHGSAIFFIQNSLVDTMKQELKTAQ